MIISICFFFQAEDGIRDSSVTGVQTCALPISFDGGVSDVFVLEYPVGINREGVRNGVDAKHPCYWTSEGTVAVLRPGHFVLHDEVFPFLLFRIQAHAED